MTKLPLILTVSLGTWKVHNLKIQKMVWGRRPTLRVKMQKTTISSITTLKTGVLRQKRHLAVKVMAMEKFWDALTGRASYRTLVLA
jgi:hypothetical protein